MHTYIHRTSSLPLFCAFYDFPFFFGVLRFSVFPFFFLFLFWCFWSFVYVVNVVQVSRCAGEGVKV